MVSRRSFIQSSIVVVGGTMLGANTIFQKAGNIITVKGPIASNAIGISLIHEHILVDFVGADQYNQEKWKDDDVIKKMLPYLQKLKETGCRSMFDCTPNYLGRDVRLLQQLSTASGLNIITNTGYYGGSVNKYLPAHAFTETEHQLAARWIKEFKDGIDGTSIRPGFIKISVNEKQLSPISIKLIRSAGYCHLETGLTIASHTGPAIPAFEQIDNLKKLGVAADAFIWVHAQNEQDWEQFVKAAKQGAWVSLDALRDENVLEYVEMLGFLKKEKCLHRVLISHDAGWYEPDKPGGGTVRGYTTLFEKLIPALTKSGFSERNISGLLRVNPSNAFTVNVRKIS